MNSKVTFRTLAFGAFQLDVVHRLLKRDGGEVVPLTPKAFELLLILVENRGRLLTKSDLMNRVWPDSFVEEGNLTQTVSVLRKALGEQPHEHQYIVTEPGQGYRFVAEVREAGESADEWAEEISIDSTDARDFTDGKARREEPSIIAIPVSTPAPSVLQKRLSVVAVGLVVVSLLGLGYVLTRPAAPPKTITEVKSIAVLPFKNIGAKADEEYLGEGLSEVLISRLSNVKTIIVRSSSAAMKFADGSPDPKKIGSELNVEAIVIGRVQKVDENIRVTVQLMRVSDGATLWAETFDDKFTNIFAVQDSISEQVTKSLSITLTTGEREQITKRYTANTKAFQLYLQGRYFWNKRTPEGFLKAIEQFEKAIQLDPNYALAYVGLANCYVLLPEYNSSNPHESFPKAKAAIKKALEIDERSAEAYTALGYAQAFYDWDSAGAEQSFKRAIELNPNYATAHQWYGEFLSDVGRFDDAQRHYERALEIDPLSLIIGMNLAILHYDKREPEKAIAQANKVIELDPNFAYGSLHIGYTYEYLRRDAEAVEFIAKSTALSGEPPDIAEELRNAFEHNKSIKEFWQKRMEQIETRPHLKDYSAYGKAVTYLRTGDYVNAWKWLNVAIERRDRFIHTAKNTPELDPLRDDPRFITLLNRVGLN